MGARDRVSEPRPADVNRRLAMLEALIREVREDYAWTHGWANNPSRSGESLETKLHAGAVSDEVSTIVVSRDKESARRAMIRVSDNVDEALALMRAARFQLKDKIRQRDPMPTKMGPALASRVDRREAHAAQKRRMEREENIP